MIQVLVQITSAGASLTGGTFTVMAYNNGVMVQVLAVGVTLAALQAGITYNNVPIGSTHIRIQATNGPSGCTNYVDQAIVFQTTTTTTTTTTSTTTAPPTTTTTTTLHPDAGKIAVDASGSGDMSITGITVNGVAVTFSSGTDFPVGPGQTGNFTTTEIGTYNIVVTYSSHTTGKNLAIAGTCYDDTGGGIVIGGGTKTQSVNTAAGQIGVTAATGDCV